MNRFSGKLGDVHVIHGEPGEDLLEAIQRGVAEAGIHHGIILQGVGSLTRYRVHAVGDDRWPVPNLFFADEGGYDILAVQGYVLGGRVHAHVTVSDSERAIGGHMEPGCRIFTFALVSVAEVEGMDLTDLDRRHRARH